MIGILQHTTEDNLNRRISQPESDWILMEWLPEFKDLPNKISALDVRFYLATKGVVRGYFKVKSIKDGVVPTLVLGDWVNIMPRKEPYFEGYKVYDHAKVSKFFIDKHGAVFLGDHRLGTINGERYITWRNKNHFMRKFAGFGISVELLAELRARKIQQIVILYNLVTGGQEAYQSNISQWLNSDLRHSFFGDEQIFVPLDEMIKK